MPVLHRFLMTFFSGGVKRNTACAPSRALLRGSSVVVRPARRSGVFGQQTGLRPSLYATAKRLHISEPLSHISGCLPGSSRFGGLGTIKDDLLVLRHGRRHRCESRIWDRSVQTALAALCVVFVAAHQ